MKPSSRLACLTAVVFATSPLFGQLAEEFHTWTNTAGKTVEATLVSVDAAARTVKIKTRNGQEFDVPIASLSAADFEYAKTRYAAMKAAPAAAPAMPATAATTPPAAPGAPAAPAAPTAPAPAAAKGAPKKPAPPRPAFAVLPVAKFKAPAANDYIGGIQKVRPRMIQNAAGWAAIKGQVATDPVLAKLLENLKASGEDLLKDPELNRINGEIRGTVSEGSRAIYRMGLLAALHYGDGDLKWKERAVREVILLCDKSNFRDWHPTEAQAVADMVIAVSLGYDWFRDGFNAQQATEIRTFLMQKGVEALIAHLNEDEIPATAYGTAPGATATAKKAPAKAAPKKADKNAEVAITAEQMASAAALLVAAISFADEDIEMAKKAASTGAKFFGEGIQRFAPAGVWPEGMAAGDSVMDYVAMVVQSLRSAANKDLGMTMLEGIPQFGMARMHLYGPSNLPFNFGDSAANAAQRPWVATWLCGLHGNPGIPAVTAGAKMAVSSSYFGHAGHFMYYNPHAAGEGTPDSMEYAMPGGIAATARTGWAKTDMFVAVKGGDNNDLHAQLDIGSFVLDAAGQRFGLELGMESDRAPGLEVKPGADRTKRFELYLEGTAGQNTISFGENQDFEAKAGILVNASSPEQGVAVVDMTKAYSKVAKDVHRGIMAVRGATPYIVIQDDLNVKNSKTMTWKMHTKAEIAADGAVAKLTQGGKTLIATIVSPKGATFATDEPPLPTNEQMRTLGKDKDGKGEGNKILKVDLADIKGPTSLCITFTTAETAPAHTHKPIAEWVKKR